MSIISVNNLSFSYGDRKILNNITFKVKKASFISIVGSNNCGKTTLIKCLSGIMPVENVITIDDIILNRRNIKRYSRNIGVVFSNDQNQFLFDKVIDEIIFPLCNLNYSKKKINESLSEIDKLLFLGDILKKEVWELNDIEKLKVLLATAIIHHPKILLLDDVFVGLDDSNREKIILILKRVVKEFDLTIISTTSSLTDTVYSDAILVMNNGIIKYSGTLNDILNYDNTLTKIGIDIPMMMDMSLKLKFYDLLDRVILNEEEMVDTLWD